jgi:hypothetical protein
MWFGPKNLSAMLDTYEKRKTPADGEEAEELTT